MSSQQHGQFCSCESATLKGFVPMCHWSNKNFVCVIWSDRDSWLWNVPKASRSILFDILSVHLCRDCIYWRRWYSLIWNRELASCWPMIQTPFMEIVTGACGVCTVCSTHCQCWDFSQYHVASSSARLLSAKSFTCLVPWQFEAIWICDKQARIFGWVHDHLESSK